MEFVPFVAAYVAIAVFIVAVIARVVMWSKLPMHVRWELYPVAHEGGGKAAYGGSYLEEVDWWTKPRHVSMMGELKVMVPEILFLVALKEHNPELWKRSFPFHFGLYLVIGCTVAMMGTGVLAAVAPGLVAGAFGTSLQYLVIALGASGLVLGLVGALGLLERRLNSPELKDFTAPADIFNLVIFVVAFGWALATFLVVDRDFGHTLAFVRGLVTFSFPATLGGGLATWMPTVSVVLMAALVAYIPLTHMSHFIGKYFAYHAIRWNDTPNLRGGDQEAAIGEMLQQPLSWSAAHIGGDGKKTWAEAATEEVKK